MTWNKITKSLGITWNKNTAGSATVEKTFNLLQEDGSKILQEDGHFILIELLIDIWNKISKSSGIIWNKIK